jgi:hypothetical protein
MGFIVSPFSPAPKTPSPTTSPTASPSRPGQEVRAGKDFIELALITLPTSFCEIRPEDLGAIHERFIPGKWVEVEKAQWMLGTCLHVFGGGSFEASRWIFGGHNGLHQRLSMLLMELAEHDEGFELKGNFFRKRPQ